MRRLPRFHWHGLVGASAALIAAGVLVPGDLKAPQLVENRVLAKLPAAPRDLASLHAFPKAMDAYVNDRFPARSYLIPWLNALRMSFGVSGSDRVIVGRDGWLFYDDGTHLGGSRAEPALTRAAEREWLGVLAGRTEFLRQRGVPYVLLVAPSKETVYPQFAPAWYDGPSLDRAGAVLPDLSELAEAGSVVQPHGAIAEQAHWGLKTYSRHDTHWTGLGAYLGYVELMRRLQALGIGVGPRPLEAFTEVERLPGGRPHDLALMLGVASFVSVDFPELIDPADEKRLNITYLSPSQRWTAPQVIDTGQADKPILLMTRDSFSTVLLPYLLGDFSRIILAHNDDGAWRQDLIERFAPDVVVLEVVENGILSVMEAGPAPSAAALARIDKALAGPGLRKPPRRWRVVKAGKAIEGTAAGETLIGTWGDDEMTGRAGDDVVEGRAGDDVLRGGRGRDTVSGGDGDDWISGDRGDDVLMGGRGSDAFHGFAGAGIDTVLDFSSIEGDRVVLDAGTAFTVKQAGADTVIEMTGGRLILRGVDAASLPEGWIAQV